MLQHADLGAPRIYIVSSALIGDGNPSATCRTQIAYNANAERAISLVICKLTSGIPAALDMAAAYGVYHREVGVYEFFGADAPLNTPRRYFAKASADGRAMNIVLEDLSESRRAGDQVAGCSQAYARAVVTEFAKLHRAHRNDPRLGDATWLFNRAQLADATGVSFARGAAVFRQRFSGRLDARHLDAMDRFTPVAADWTRRHGASGQTLIHGEPRVDNIVFRDILSGPQAWLIDWQFADRGSPMFDTAHFLAGSLTPADRRACERDLIVYQQGEIARTVPGYTLDLALAKYADALPFGLFTTVGSALAVPEGEGTDQLLMTLLARKIDALRDWDRIPK